MQPEQAGSGSMKEVRQGDDSEVPGHDLTPAAAASVTAAKCYVHLATMQVCAVLFLVEYTSSRPLQGFQGNL